MTRPRVILLLCTAALLAGCNSNMSDLKQYVKKVRARKSGHVQPIPKVTHYTPFIYIAKGKRDPFQRLLLAVPTSKSTIHPNMKRPRDPLEAFPLDGLRMVGTISIGGTTYALIRAPDGVVHRATVGDHLGQHYGKITAITPSAIKIIQLMPDGMGGWKQQPATLTLSQK